MRLVPVDERTLDTPDTPSAVATLAEDGFESIWDLRVAGVEFVVRSFRVTEPTSDPQVAMRVRARLRKVPALRALGREAGLVVEEVVDDGEPVRLSLWNAEDGRRVGSELAAACARIAARMADSELAAGRRLAWRP